MKEKLIEQFENTTLTFISNKIKTVFTKNLTKTGCRVYKNDKIGIASCIGKADLKELYEKAERNLAYQIDYPVEPTKNIKSHIKIDSCKITSNEFLIEFEKILKDIARLHPDFSINNEVRLLQSKFSMENELGMDLSYFDKVLMILFLMKSKNSSDELGAPFLLQSRELEPERIIKGASEIITAYSNLLPMPKEPLPLILRDEMIIKIFSKELRADVFGTGSSLFQHQLGKEVFSKNFSLMINTNPSISYFKHFDAEGTITPEHLSYLIKDGVITRPFSNKLTSKLYGFENTGSAGGDYKSVPYLGRSNLVIQQGNKTLKEILNGQKGILVYFTSGGDFTPEGVFATPVQVSYLTDGEKLLGRLPVFIIKGSVYDFLGKDYMGKSSDELYTNINQKMLVTKMAIEPI